ncbi:HXXXD-type acyl-transferase-like protein [Rhynchospora pubera]|uniref:HXXXD-type acyl-transferase-like protein n=1 Tax=Rhynchospora pubera TaxID=906938 RepID=A0AAV8DDL6_9POAL|nr:HXXXD-type acyl-transferase-like protein [Rhynchospora pubera]KAJ4817899.1 HXXXD-type acyl-transferase-like protein [Rhynchospora pubera]
MPSRTFPPVRIIKTYTVTPRPNPEVPRQLHLSAWDVGMLSTLYIQRGLLFTYPPDLSAQQIIERLRSSLEEALFHFYILSGRLRVVSCEGGGVTCHVEVECEGDGAEFVHAVADEIGVTDVVTMGGQDLPKFLKEFFPLDLAHAVNFDGCTKPLLTVQFTELIGGIFIGCTFNHVIGDGTSFWHFFDAWAEITRCKAARNEVILSQPPVHDRWFIGGYGEPPIKLPYSSPAEFVVRPSTLLLREKMFHFSSESLAKLKERANQEYRKGIISTFQALSALMWRSITRARCCPPDQKTSCQLIIQNRARLQPPLSPNYFGNSICLISTSTTARELLDNNLGWSSWLAHQIVSNHTDSAIRDQTHKYMKDPFVYNGNMFDKHSILMVGSPWFNMYGCDFGWGKPLAARCSIGNKFDGKISAYPGWEGGGSVDLEVCLLPEYMSALERDEEFLAVVSPPIDLEVLLGTSNKDV